MLVLEDMAGEPLDRLLGTPMEMERFLGLAIVTSSTKTSSRAISW